MADLAPSYELRPLGSPYEDIRVIHLLPGKPDDDIHLQISHVTLQKKKDESSSKRLTRAELQKTLPPGWEVFETPEGRYLFCYDPGDDEDSGGEGDSCEDDEDGEEDGFKTAWIHPDPKVDPALYKLPPDSDIWNREPVFEALSYVWGPQEDPEVAFVESPDGGDIEGSIRLGPNLASALHHLRYEGKPRTLWVDAICINQTDNDEKAIQVKRMSEIYAVVTRVVVWLGAEEDESALALSTLEHLGSQVETTLDGYRLTTPDAEEPTWYDIDVDLPYSDRVWQAIKGLAERSWFTRVWTAQEILLANRLAILQCGNATITWSLFRRAVECLLDKKTLPKGRNALSIARTAIVNGSQRSLAQVLRRNAARDCHDPHDKVYGMLAMAPPKFQAALMPDYKQPVADTYKQTLLLNFELVRRWEIFGCSVVDRIIKAPSWVQDLHAHSSYSYSSADQFTAGCSELQYVYKAPDQLQVRGVRFSTIKSVGEVVPNNGRAALPVIRSWEPPGLLTDDCYVGGGSLLDAFAVMLLQGCLRERNPIEEGWPTLPEWKRFLCNKLLSTAKQPMETLDRGGYLNDLVFRRCEGRSFVITESGHFGLGPVGCRPGDEVSVILGCGRPLVIRSVKNAKYDLIGDAFFHDLQDAQALLGPLPKPWRVQVFDHPDQEFRRIYRYFNSETKELSDEDPRLESLVGWERIPLDKLGRGLNADDPEICDFYRSLENGRVVDSDPRLLPGALENRGVGLETLILV